MNKEKTFIGNFAKEREYEHDGNQTFLLYDNENQDNLVAIASSVDEMKEESKYYASGVWFECDNAVDSNVILNERKSKRRVKFLNLSVESQESIPKKKDKFALNSNVGDLR